MGLFYNFDRPGRGISEEEAKRRNYFEILGRNFTPIIKVNMLFFATNILLFAALFILLMPFFSSDNAVSKDLASYISAILSSKTFLPPLPFIIFALFAPTTSGLTYVCRNFAKQEHAFIASDFFEQTKKNFGQSILLGFILSAIWYLYLTALLFYINSGYTVIAFFLLSLGFIFILAGFYIFPLIVTFKMSVFSILKNSVFLALANAPQNLLVFIVLSAIHILLILYLPVIWLVLMIFFLIGFSSYSINFVAWNIIEKSIEQNNSENN